MDRFDLELAINDCFSTNSDLDLLCENILDGDFDKDFIVNTLLGIKNLNEMRCQKVFDTFEKMLYEGLIITKN